MSFTLITRSASIDQPPATHYQFTNILILMKVLFSQHLLDNLPRRSVKWTLAPPSVHFINDTAKLHILPVSLLANVFFVSFFLMKGHVNCWRLFSSQRHLRFYLLKFTIFKRKFKVTFYFIYIFFFLWFSYNLEAMIHGQLRNKKNGFWKEVKRTFKRKYIR